MNIEVVSSHEMHSIGRPTSTRNMAVFKAILNLKTDGKNCVRIINLTPSDAKQLYAAISNQFGRARRDRNLFYCRQRIVKDAEMRILYIEKVPGED